ncbi:hypothetical protein AKJ57_04565 [candidate division MSBL1 archaeon SCGC-AAA259A05]|uniref:Protease PrsW n=1 Tax=candidate division MSBL1 archaeon SCGC-AAA259A05 TaxID=1698259 RepID=A0A133U756_9EURY|nr:hypothetical protein AKJ57_04565 [candidate division MSBL1 archaeon SCGC-AAA259A05]
MKSIFEMEERELVYTAVLIFLSLGMIALVGDFTHYYWFEIEICYGVSVGPIFEEALKGGALMLLFVILLHSLPNSRDRLTSKEAWLVGGALAGLGFGLSEDWTTYSFSTARVVPTLNHSAWTALVGLGIWTYMDAGVRWNVGKVGIPFAIAAVSHMVWNYHAYLVGKGEEDIVLSALSWAMTFAALVVVWRTELKFQQGS